MNKYFNASKSGVLPSQTIRDFFQAGFIKNSKNENIRPSSLDLSISDDIYEIEGIFQPKRKETVREVLNKIKNKKHSLNKPLECGKMYLIRLNETLDLPESVYAICNPKSTSGRIDVHVRLLADGVPRYDLLSKGFKGELWISVMPKTFPVKFFSGVSLNQLRFFNSDSRLNDFELEIEMKKNKLLWHRNTKNSYKYDEIDFRDNDSSVILTLDTTSKILGYEGVVSKNVVDLSKLKFYDSKKFFKPIKKIKGYVHLKKDCFYILSTHEAVRVPPNLACEMIPMDERSGEFRSHYAGFIDPGWGWGKDGEGVGRPLTLEVRPFEDILVREGQPISKIRFERLIDAPDVVYDATNSNYLVQSGPKLAKHFK
jgi:dCTP deaminase